MLTCATTKRLAAALLAAVWLGCGEERAPSTADTTLAGPDCGPATAEVSVENELGRLHGTLELPDGCGPFTVALVIAGSGRIDRDGNGDWHTDAYKQLAAALAQRGIATLRYDKRGIGASADAAPADEADFRFEMFLDDALRWLRLLQLDARFDRIAVIGHSEGSLLGLAAAEAQPLDALALDAFVSVAGPGRSMGDVLRAQLAALYPELADESEAIISALEAGERVDDVPDKLLPVLRPSVQPLWISELPYLPAEMIAELDAPALIVQGDRDEALVPEDAELLAAAQPDAELHVIADMNHTLKHVGSERELVASYTDPSVPLADELVEAIAAFLR